MARLTRLSGLSGVSPVGDRVREDRSYLVTGGFGGIGLRVAGWLAERGAGAIVLNRRRAVDAEAAALATLREQGAEVRAEIADVTDGEAVEALLSRMDRELPPLGGVIHSAGVLSDGTVGNLDWGRFEKVLWPKVLGAWRLHRATLYRDLDLFVLFSSAVGVLGSPGQANYAAANAFLDQLARHRRGLGLPGQAIAWGGWSESGMAAAGRGRMEDRMGEAGVGWLRPEQGLEALTRLVGADVGTSVAVRVDWSRLPFRPPLLEEVAGGAGDESRAVSGELAERLRGVPDSEREEVLTGFLREEVASVLRLRSVPAPDAGFFDLGMDSLMAVEFRNRLDRALGGALTLSNTLVFDYPDVARLARHLADELGDAVVPAPGLAPRLWRGSGIEERVAIVGMACRFPGGQDVEGFWELLRSGGFAVTRGRPDGLMVDGEGLEEPPWGAYVPDLDRFDAEFFGIAPVEAELMDPQQRLLLETSWQALEDAGLDPGRLRGSRTGVYAGIMNRDYEHLAPLVDAEGGRGAYLTTGMGNAAAVGRVSFTLGLQGPAVAVDTACSSSLVAIHQATAALRQGEADLALAGGVNVILSAALSSLTLTAGMLSPRGRCSTFDAAADGYVRGEGCGMVVLKRLSEAERDGDRILGLVLGSAVNQDGASAGFTVPNGPAQEVVIGEALSRAGIEPAEVDYLEAHGTGTELGDPIEVQAAAAVYGEGRDAERPLLLGSVKTNVGHLESAAGVAGVVKALLAMRHDLIPPHLHFEHPNPRIGWEDLPVRVTSESTPWPGWNGRRRTAVSSFGYSGTNAHLILEGYDEERRPVSRWVPSDRPSSPGGGRPLPADETPHAPRTHRVLPISGKTPQALRELATRYQAWLTEETPLADAAWTAGVGRSHFAHRAGVTFRDLDSLREALELVERGAVPESAPGGPGGPGGKVAFLYTGEGSEWAGMGRELHAAEPVFREVLERCESAFRAEHGESLLAVMFGEDAAGAGEEPDRPPDRLLARPEWAQPALYALQSALTALWESVGVRPDAVLGHGVGEIAAARAAEVFDVEGGLRFAARRGALLGSLPRSGRGSGGMLAVFAPLSEVVSAISEVGAGSRGQLDVAAENGMQQVVSGPPGLVGKLSRRFRGMGVRVERLPLHPAGHGSLVEPVLGGLEEAASALSFAVPRVALVSGLTGRRAVSGEVEEGTYWRRQARQAVRFAAGVETLASLGCRILIELGPRGVLGPLAAQCWPAAGETAETAGPVLVSSQDGAEAAGDGGFAAAVAGAYGAGVEVAFEGLFAEEERRRVALPTYPFQRERYWVETPRRRRTAEGHPLLGVRRESPRGEVSFETSTGALSWMEDHRVFGEVVAPGALYGAQVIEALGALGRGPAVSLEEMQIHRPLVLSSDEERTVQVVLGTEDRFEVFSREAGGEAWQRHAEGRFGAAVGGGEALDVEEARSGLAAVEVAEVYRELAAAGIGLVGVFRGLTGLWSGPDEAVGEVSLPADAAREGLAVHPALLDGCFQVLSGVPELGDEGGVWLPFGWERLWVTGPLPERVVCRARLREGDGETRQADLGLYATDGAPLGGVEGFTLRRASRAALRASGVDELLYEVAWREGPAVGVRSAAFLADPETVVSGTRSLSEIFSEVGVDGAGLSAEGEALERESRWFALRAFRELGWERRSGDRFEAEELRRRLKVTGEHRRLFGRLLGLLDEAGVTAPDPAGGWLVTADSEEGSPEEVMEPEEGAVSAERGLLRRCGASLSEVLRGRADPLELLFGEESGAAEVYRDSVAGRALNRLVGEAVGGAVAGLPEGRRLAVLEVGAGTGATTAAVLEALPAERTRYEYTDLSAGFFAGAESEFGAVGADLHCRVLDIERDPVEQGFGRHGYDVVIAANVLHATRDLGESLSHCRKLLAPSGLLLAVEGTAARGWLDLTFGLLPGWWRFDDAYRGDYALVGREVWRRALSDAGYGEVGFLEGAGDQTVIVARGPSEPESERGLFVLSGGEELAGALSRELTGRGQTVLVGPEAGEREEWRSFFGSLPEGVPLRGVAHLAGVREDEAELTTAELAGSVATVGRSGLSLVQGMTDAGVRPGSGVWFVTRGGQVVAGETVGALSGSPLWGFGPVVGLEHPDLGPRLLDLDPGRDPGEAPSVAALADELLVPDRETRVALRGGERRVARLARLPVSPPDGDRIRGDRSYLVTGGLGGIGLAVAGWLSERGAGAIVLNGRRAPDAGAAAAVASLRERGAEVRVEIGDVTDGEAVDGLMARVDRDLPPLGGVIHSVGVLSDGALENLDWSRFEEVLWPKVLGAWHLHRATLDRDLDLFLLFSSATGVFGNPGQANHAAANAFLDQLARRRRALGLPGQAIAWGAWSEIGEAEEQRERIAGRLPVLGEGWIAPERGLEALSRLVQADVGTSVVVAADWSLLPSRPPLLEEVAGADAAGTPAAPGDLTARLRKVSAAEREEVLTAFLQEELVSVLRLRSVPAPDAGFFDLGMDSLMAVELRNRLNRALGGMFTLSNTAVFDHPDAARLARHLAEALGDAGPEERRAAPTVSVRRRDEERVAIVGMACRFPGGNDPTEFWGSLVAGRDAVTRGRPDGLFVDAETQAARAYGAYVEGLDRFDAEFFRIAPVEAELLDPQQRMLLETSWAALEDAGLDPGRLRGSRTGVYVGIMNNDYRELLAPLARDPSLGLYTGSGVTFSTAVGRVAFVLGLEGPAIAVDTACSSSLVAVHQAAMALRQGEADLALAGGVNAILFSRFTDLMADAGMLAADGRCKTFDAAADGFVRGEGCGIVALKRLSEAERDGDRILGVLLGSAVNQDGASAGLTVPNGPAQERVIGEALSRAGIEPAEVDYLEAHGTGTELGDPVEVEAAASVYGEGREAARPLLLGSVKTNVGHLEGAAGVAGLIKAVLAMRHGVIPRHLHFDRPNPRIGWEDLPVRVVSEEASWPAADRPRRAAVSSFGYSGTNAHLILEGYDQERRPVSRWGPSDRHRPPEADETPYAPRTDRVLPLSGKTPQALRELATRYQAWLTEESPLADVAWTAGVGRSHFAHRAGIIFRDLDSLREALELVERGADRESAPGRKVAFLYTGQGSQWAGMGRELHAAEPAFREVLERCESAFRAERGESLLAVMFEEDARGQGKKLTGRWTARNGRSRRSMRFRAR